MALRLRAQRVPMCESLARSGATAAQKAGQEDSMGVAAMAKRKMGQIARCLAKKLGFYPKSQSFQKCVQQNTNVTVCSKNKGRKQELGGQIS